MKKGEFYREEIRKEIGDKMNMKRVICFAVLCFLPVSGLVAAKIDIDSKVTDLFKTAALNEGLNRELPEKLSNNLTVIVKRAKEMLGNKQEFTIAQLEELRTLLKDNACSTTIDRVKDPAPKDWEKVMTRARMCMNYLSGVRETTSVLPDYKIYITILGTLLILDNSLILWYVQEYTISNVKDNFNLLDALTISSLMLHMVYEGILQCQAIQ